MWEADKNAQIPQTLNLFSTGQIQSISRELDINHFSILYLIWQLLILCGYFQLTKISIYKDNVQQNLCTLKT